MKTPILRYVYACVFIAASFTSHTATAEFLKQGPSVFNYNFAELKYLDFDGADGFGVVGSGDIRSNIAIRVDYANLEEGNVDVDMLKLGATYYIQSQSYPQADLNFATGIDRIDDETGLFLSAGTRYALNDVVELNAVLELSTAGDTDVSLNLAGFYEVKPGLSAFVEAEFGDGSALALGARFYWR